MRTFAYDIEGNDQRISEVDALIRGMKFDIIIAQWPMYQYIAGQMIANDPTLIMGMYCNGTHTNKAPPFYPPDYYVWSEKGEPITSVAFPGNYLMNPRSGWLSVLTNEVRANLARSHMNAIYIDELGVGPIKWQEPSSVSAPPIDPRTGVAWTWRDWMSEMNRLIGVFRAGFIDVPIIVNGLGNGARFFEPPLGDPLAVNGGNTAPLLDWSNRALAESFLRGSAQAPTYYPSAPAWEREVKMIAAGGPNLMACSKIWTSVDPNLVNRIHRWALGSFLLGAYPKAAWYFTGEKARTVTPWNALWDKAQALGRPLALRDGTHRDFTNGSVDVDNAAHDATIRVGS